MNRTLLALMLALCSVASAQVELSDYDYLAEGDSTVFYVSDESMDWHSAHAAAVLAGGHLATFASIEENLSVLSELGAEGVWLGLFQDSLGLEPDGGWRWSGEGPVVFTNWDDSDPNDSNGGEDCGSGIGFFGSWQDQECHLSFRYVLEVQTVVFGCTDLSACNYNPEANEDDGSCFIVDLGEDIETCEDSLILDAGDGFGNYLWSTGETSQSITVSESGLYEATVSSHPANEGSLSFDGDDDWVEAATIDLTGHPFNIEGWIKVPSVSHAHQTNVIDNYVFGSGGSDRWGVYVGGLEDDDMGFEWRGQLYAPTFGIPPTSGGLRIDDNQWHHFAVERGNDGVASIYIDGILNGIGDCPLAYNLNAGFPTRINGGFHCGGGQQCRFMGCEISEIKISLTEKYTSDFEPPCQIVTSSDAILHYRFGNTNGDTVLDLSGSENHGAIHGASWSEEVPFQDCLSCESSDEIVVDFDDCDAYCGEGTVWDPFNQECIVAIPTDTDFDGCVAAGDLLNLLGTFGSCPPIPFSGPCQGQDHVTYEGYDYDIVAIGEQCWFAENLQAESYRNGDEIESGISDAEWSSLSGATSVYGEGTSDCESFAPDGDACIEDWPLVQYGRLYNWYAVDDERGLCPFGWHVPSLSHWTELTVHLDSLGDAGFLMKTSTGWSNNGGGSNDSGFSGLPTGYRNWDGSFLNAGKRGYWWSCTPHPSESDAWAYYLRLVESQNHVDHFHDEVELGFAIRCIKDQ